MSAPAARYIGASFGASSSRVALGQPTLARSARAISTTSPANSSSNGPFKATPPASASPAAAPSNELSNLSWDKYLQLRKSRRLAGMVTTIPTTLLAGAAAGSYFLTLEIDPTNTIAGLDPIYINAGLTLACTGLGWLTGPTVGNSIWSLLHRKNAKQIAEKDHDFYEHIKRNRVDPTRQSVQNPVPDYYGEKIGSIKQYRQWLRDQAAFRRKAAHGLENDA
ncbi:Mitochondrial import protein Pam17 [Kalmanozyma brasiliensis GHG001]|uniref:Presequence translocated-associated motor subunit PAM17 n=1 Tax=Kalmanozyma brasiliensis (strain GHG001) TaxID=1365824 RepID=V5GFY2_KALBG|nr:Mitochondrial import protein Pam17 [Kalmanozyma brasiliensis GHG001]EST04932.1 Mitochondrial import protein Pam17 [Kalmanozyma brasiliensis GHG001]